MGKAASEQGARIIGKQSMVLCVVGTRPEAVKMAPVILALRNIPKIQVRVLATAQHREMLDEALAQFGIEADFDLDIMQPNQTLAELTGRLLAGGRCPARAGRPGYRCGPGRYDHRICHGASLLLPPNSVCSYRGRPAHRGSGKSVSRGDESKFRRACRATAFCSDGAGTGQSAARGGG